MITSTSTTPTIAQAPKNIYVKGKCPSSRAQLVFLDLDGNLIKNCEIVYVSELPNPKPTFVQKVAGQKKTL
jgi:hypothetical protein